MIRALFFDVDGTLLSFDTHRVPDSTREALREAHERGVKILIATGRPASALGALAGIEFDGVVALNGADALLPDGRRIGCTPIPPDEFVRVQEVAREFDFPVILELNEGMFADRITPGVVEFARMVDLPVPIRADLRAVFERYVCCQMCFFVDPASEREVMSRLPALSAARWSPLFVDVNLRGVDKAKGLETFAAHFGFTPGETMAFGDGGNDVPMLRAAGIGVAMGGASDAVKAAADHVTTAVDDDGIRRALAYFGVIGDGI